MRTSGTFVIHIFLVGLILGSGYYFFDEWKTFLFPYKPCEEPITYSLGTFDTRFGISKQAFIKTIKNSEGGWEEAMGKQLFTYSEEGDLKVHLIYDYRQQTTDQLSDVGIAISEDRAGYNKIKAQYEALISEYTSKNQTYERQMASYEVAKESYDQKVLYWNKKGGAPNNEYQTLKKEQERLNSEATILNRKAAELNSLVADINGTGSLMNDLAKKLNIKVENYNTIGASTGEEFNEGEYIRDTDGIRINVYQYGDETKLRRLLQHELGHALGLNHVEDPKAIMFRLNANENEKLTESDLSELRKVCGGN